MKYTANTPEGTKDRLFAECRDRRRVQQTLSDVFTRWNYEEIITPNVEFYDLFVQSGNPMPQERMLKIIDRSGKIMVMRPDCTTPIARVAATKLGYLSLPQRLFYNQTVFRSGQAHKGGSSEIAQCGVELIGASGAKADVEMIAMAVEGLRGCGLGDTFHIELGHVGFFRELAARIDLPEDVMEQVRTCIESKNFAALGDLLQPYQHCSGWAPLKRISQLFGGPEVLDEAEELAGESSSVAYLRALYRELEQAGYGKYIRFDLGLIHQIDYYTGVVFRGYAEGAGEALLSGGRYDNLVGAFGRPAPATGFAVDVDGVVDCLTVTEVEQPTGFIHYELGQFGVAVAQMTAESGKWALSPKETLAESVALAKEKGATTLLVCRQNGEKEWMDV